MKRLLFPVETHTGGFMPTPRAVAVFFTSSDAIDFISAEHPLRCLYLGTPRYDQRKAGYRFEPAPVVPSYEEWLASLEPKELPDGRFQVAA